MEPIIVEEDQRWHHFNTGNFPSEGRLINLYYRTLHESGKINAFAFGWFKDDKFVLNSPSADDPARKDMGFNFCIAWKYVYLESDLETLRSWSDSTPPETIESIHNRFKNLT